MNNDKRRSVKVLIVEDEGIIAQNIERSLTRLGYEVLGICGNSSEVLPLLRQTLPDLILMDIHIEGEEDGVSLAEKIGDLFSVPIVYLSALMDDATLQRAKITQPFGYIAKPFSQRELEITLDIALYKAEMERRLAEKEIHIQKIVDSLRQGFCLIDEKGLIRYANKELSRMTERSVEDLISLPLGKILYLPKPEDGPLYEAWKKEEAFESYLLDREGRQHQVIVTARHLESGLTEEGFFLSITDAETFVRLPEKEEKSS